MRHAIVPVLVLALVMPSLGGCRTPRPDGPTPAAGAGRGAGAGLGGAEDCRTQGRIVHLDDLFLLPTGHNHPDLAPPEPMSPARVCFYR